MALPVKAIESGVGIGVIGNMSTFDTTGYEQEVSGDLSKTTASISEDVDFGSFFGEWYARGDHFGLGLGIEIIPGDHEIGAKSRTDANDAKDTSDDGTYTAKAEVSKLSTLYIEPTIYFNDMFGAYVKGGYSYIEVNSLESIDLGSDSSAYGKEDVFGTVWGAGVRVNTAMGLFLKLEYTETDYEEFTMKSLSGNKNTITAEPEQKATRLAIGWRF